MRFARRERLRRPSGMLALGIAGLVLLVFAIIAGITFSWNVGMSEYYQGKLMYVADQAAHYAAARYCWYQNTNPAGISSIQGSTQAMVTNILTSMGLPDGTVTVSLAPDGHTVVSALTVSGMVLPGKGNLPGVVNLQASGYADLDADQPPALVCLTFQNDPTHQTVVCPSWGWYVEGITDMGVPPAPLPDINIERDFESIYYTIAIDLPTGVQFQCAPGTAKAPGVP
jgi:hypothetical protein